MKKEFTEKRMEKILFDTCMALIDSPVACKRISIGNRYRLADTVNDIVKEQTNKVFSHK